MFSPITNYKDKGENVQPGGEFEKVGETCRGPKLLGCNFLEAAAVYSHYHDEAAYSTLLDPELQNLTSEPPAYQSTRRGRRMFF